MHKKDQVIAPIFESALGVSCFTPDVIDTDQFGSFSGEVARTLSPLEAALAKCDLAHQDTGCDLVVANEGSFGPHPTLFFVEADDELMVLRDYKNNLTIGTRLISSATNLNSLEITNINQLRDFANSLGFPTHGIILKAIKPGVIVKDSGSIAELCANALPLLAADGKCIAETDMRAMNNPTRMKLIEELTHKLVTKIKSTCPLCKTPGFDVIRVNSGLPCMACKSETSSTRSLVKGCLTCRYEELIEYPHNKREEDPMYCNYCNP
jgi:hypothetical protein